MCEHSYFMDLFAHKIWLYNLAIFSFDSEEALAFEKRFKVGLKPSSCFSHDISNCDDVNVSE